MKPPGAARGLKVRFPEGNQKSRAYPTTVAPSERPGFGLDSAAPRAVKFSSVDRAARLSGPSFRLVFRPSGRGAARFAQLPKILL